METKKYRVTAESTQYGIFKNVEYFNSEYGWRHLSNIDKITALRQLSRKMETNQTIEFSTSQVEKICTNLLCFWE